MSGVAKQTPPPTDGGGRMYSPLPDRTTVFADGSIQAETRGHTIYVTASGSITITSRRTGEVEFRK